MKLGLVGHHRTVKIVTGIINKFFPDIALTPVLMDTTEIEPVVSYIKAYENQLDGLLFTGKIPYDLINTAIISQKPWAYIRHDIARLLSGLLEACLVHGYDIRCMSVDSYSEEDIASVFENIGMSGETKNIHIANNKIFGDDFLSALCGFHRDNFQNHGVSVCITGISAVYEYLTGLSIPCIVLDPTRQSVEDALGFYDSKKRYKLERSSEIVVLAIERDLPDEHALIKENEYQLSLESMKISEEIYLFSQRVQAAVMEREIGKFMLFTTKYLFETETEQLQKINILTRQGAMRFSTLSIGIGYGETAREAKFNANMGLLKAKKQGGNQAYKVERNQYFGPIIPTSAQGCQASDQIDGYFQKIASETGVSLNSILKLQAIIDRNKSNTYTPLELANQFGVSLRSMNRLLEKLIDARYARIIGCNMQSAAGRPSRVIRLNFESV